MKETTIYYFLITVMLVLILVMGYLVFRIKLLSEQTSKMEGKLQQITTNLPKKNYNEQENKQYTIKPPKFNFDIDPFRQFDEFDRLEKQMEEFFNKQFDNQFNNKFHINIVPKGETYMHFSNTYNINGHNFSYSVDVENNNIKGKVIFDNKESLEKIENKLKDLGLNTKLKNNQLNFWGENVDVNEVLNIFNIKFDASNPKDSKEGFF